MISTTPERRFEPLANYARHKEVSERTCRRWIGLGYFPAYKAKGIKGLIIDRDEADAALDRLPEGTVRPQGIYGPNAEIRTLDGAL